MCVVDRHRLSDTPMCPVCWSSLRDKLERTEDIVEDLELTRAGRDKIGGVPIGRVSGGSGSPLPVRPHATRAAEQLRDTLWSWTRDLWETNAARWLECDGCGAKWHGGEQVHTRQACAGKWHMTTDRLDVDVTAPGLARWILRHHTWVRKHLAADQLHRDLTDAYHVALRVIDRPDDRAYLGICSADLGDGVLCEVDLFARDGQSSIRCRGCGSVRDVNARREYLSAAVDRQYLPTGLVVAVVTRRGHRLTDSMLRNYRARGRLVAYVNDPDFMGPVDRYGWRVRPLREDDDQAALWRVSEVLDVVTTKYRRERKAG
jgi:hypothetical protein